VVIQAPTFQLLVPPSITPCQAGFFAAMDGRWEWEEGDDKWPVQEDKETGTK